MLVDYSDSSASEGEEELQVDSKPSTKPPVKKLVNAGGKIVVNFANTQATATDTDSRPAKRTRVEPSRGFDFNALLPSPKNRALKVNNGPAQSSSSGVVLKGAEPAFSRDHSEAGVENSESNKPVPQGKPEDEVKLIGNPLKFKPLSTIRKPKKNANANLFKSAGFPIRQAEASTETKAAPTVLFPLHTEVEAEVEEYVEEPVVDPIPTQESQPQQAQQTQDNLLSNITLSKAEQREFFGRGVDPSKIKFANYVVEDEYRKNMASREAGETKTHNPLRTVAPGKHSLRQLVTNAQTQQQALQESFEAGKNKRKAAAQRYGW